MPGGDGSPNRLMHHHRWPWRGLGVLAVSLMLALPAGAQKLVKAPDRGSEQQKQPDLTKRYFPSLRTEAGAAAGTLFTVEKPGPARGSSPSGDIRAVYVVAKGDTIPGIATRLGVSVGDLARVNGISSRDPLRDGQILYVPKAKRKVVLAPEYRDKNHVFADTALQYRGVPYRWAGMSSRGVDCSGLVSLVLRTNGVEAPHNAARLYELGTAVEVSELRSGDLVFFHTRGNGVSHVGIYVGDGKFIHASSRSGHVTINSLDERYYKQHFVGAKRIEAGG